MKHLLFWLLALCTLAAPAAAQGNKASAKLYTKIDGSDVQAVIRLNVDAGWHLYHTILTEDPNAYGGKPLVIELGGTDIAWTTPIVPEPEKHVDESEGFWNWVHYGTVMIYARGTLAEGATGEDIEVTLGGLTCEDKGGVCVGYDEAIEPSRFSERHFKAYPADLQAPPAPVPMWRPEFGDDVHVAGRLFVRIDGEQARAVIEMVTDPSWHVYHGPEAEDLHPTDPMGLPTRFTFDSPDIEWGAVHYPKPEMMGVAGMPEVQNNQHHGRFYFHVEGKAAAGAVRDDLTVTVDGQACDDSMCIMFEEELEPEDEDGPDAFFAYFDAPPPAVDTASGGTAPAPVLGDGEETLETMSLGAFILLAIFWGFVTLLMPCTYPMIPITISFFTKQAIARKGNVLPLSLAYGGGIVLIFILIGVVIGGPIITFATHPVTNIIIGGLFILFAFVLFGAIDLQPPAFLMKFAGKASSKGGIGGVFLMGATLVVTSFTCTAPFVGSLLSVGAESGDLFRIVLGMGVFGLTMAVPFVILSLVPGKIQEMPSAGEWMHVLKVFLGFVEIAAALKFLSNADLVWEWGIFSREVFLLLWFGIFGCAAVFLFGWIKLKGESEHEIGPLRMMGGVGTLLFSLYCGMGFIGFEMDSAMTSLIPNYHSNMAPGAPFRGGGGGEEVKTHTIVVDDYEKAVAQALSEDKLLLLNFTGVT